MCKARRGVTLSRSTVKINFGNLVSVSMGQKDALQDNMQGFLKSLRERLVFEEAAAAAAAAAAPDDDDVVGSADEDDHE